MMDIECYEKLCTAIVKQGIYDYKKALERVTEGWRSYLPGTIGNETSKGCQDRSGCSI